MDCALKQMVEELVNNSLHQMTKIRNLINKNLIKDNTKKVCNIYLPFPKFKKKFLLHSIIH